MPEEALNIYLVLGEESGDNLAADLIPALQQKAALSNQDIRFSGLAGSKLINMGHKSLFDIEDIAVMGISAIMSRLPKIITRVYQTVSDIVVQKPDVIVLIDSPEFTHAVAKRVRARLPDIPIVNYVCPSVWAWRSGRARKMLAYIDHVLAILPFEPNTLRRLGGPKATYVGHPLARQIASHPLQKKKQNQGPANLLILPGSRKGELKRMLDLFGQTLTVLRKRGVEFHPILPAIPRLKQILHQETANWPVQPQIVDSADNPETFSQARAALATSGTVVLELALHKVPMVVGYRLDPIGRLFTGLITTWSALLPNLILDRVLIPEEHNEMVIPERMARYLERLMANTGERQMQLDGFDELMESMKTTKPPSELAAEVILNHIR